MVPCPPWHVLLTSLGVWQGFRGSGADTGNRLAGATGARLCGQYVSRYQRPVCSSSNTFGRCHDSIPLFSCLVHVLFRKKAEWTAERLQYSGRDVYASMICSVRTTKHIVSLLSLSSSAVVEGSRGWRSSAVEEGQATEARQHEHSKLTQNTGGYFRAADSWGVAAGSSATGPAQPPLLSRGHRLHPDPRSHPHAAVTAPSLVTGGWLCQAVRRYGSSAHRPRPRADDPATARDLHELQRMVERSAHHWARTGQIKALVTAFNRAGKLPAAADSASPPTAGSSPKTCPQRRAVMLVLADAYLPLVPGLRSPVECTVPLRAVAKTGCGWGQDGEPPLAEALLQRLEHNGCELMRQADSKNHSQLWLSLSEGPREVAVRHAQLLDVSASQLVQMGAQGIGEQACGNVLLACARLLPRMSLGDPATLLHHLTERMVQLRGEAAEQALANTVYALARLHEQCGYTPLPEHLQALAAEVWERLSAKPGAHQERFAPQSLSNMLWAFAKFCYGHPDLLTRLAGAAAEAARRMDEQELSNSVWALGRLVEAGCLDGTKSVTGVERLSAEALWRVRHQRGAFPSQALANLLLGLAHLSSAAPPGTYKLGATVHALAAECRFGLKYQGFTSQGLTNAAWALAKLEYGDQAWYAGCAAAALQPSFYKVAVRQCWAHLWWALAAARHRPADAQLLLARTTDAMTAMRHQANGQDCNNIVWALATLGLYDSQLVRCLLGRLAELQPHGDASAQHFSNALWAVAVMGPVALSAHLQEVGALLREVARRWQGFPGRAAFQEEHLRQLWHVQVELEAHPSTDVRALAGVLPGAVSSGLSLGSAMSLAKKRKLALDSASRRVCNEVALLLQNLQQQQQQQREQPNHGSRIQSSCGLRLGPTITSLDVGGWVEQVARWVSVEVRLEGGRAVAVLVDGPDIVMANQPQERVGGALLHRRQLQRVYGEGNVVGVSVAEWEALGGDVGRQEGLLRTLLLQGAGGQQGSGSGYAQRDASAVQPLSAFQAPSSSGPSRSAPASPPVAKPPSVQELVRQRLQQMAPQAKGRSRRRPV